MRVATRAAASSLAERATVSLELGDLDGDVDATMWVCGDFRLPDPGTLTERQPAVREAASDIAQQRVRRAVERLVVAHPELSSCEMVACLCPRTKRVDSYYIVSALKQRLKHSL